MKVKLAPCQKPVRKNTSSLLSVVRTLPLRLPPSGIYTYSLNQVESEMCQRRQNSCTLAEMKG